LWPAEIGCPDARPPGLRRTEYTAAVRSLQYLPKLTGCR
jgi:hypothetical protein